VTLPHLVLAIVCVGIVLANLDLFIVNVALPNMGQDFKNATLEGLSWILNGYAIVYAATCVLRTLGERHRRDQSFLLGVALFTGASALAPWPTVWRPGHLSRRPSAGAALMSQLRWAYCLGVPRASRQRSGDWPHWRLGALLARLWRVWSRSWRLIFWSMYDRLAPCGRW